MAHCTVGWLVEKLRSSVDEGFPERRLSRRRRRSLSAFPTKSGSRHELICKEVVMFSSIRSVRSFGLSPFPAPQLESLVPCTLYCLSLSYSSLSLLLHHILSKFLHALHTATPCTRPWVTWPRLPPALEPDSLGPLSAAHRRQSYMIARL